VRLRALAALLSARLISNRPIDWGSKKIKQEHQAIKAIEFKDTELFVHLTQHRHAVLVRLGDVCGGDWYCHGRHRLLLRRDVRQRHC
jgi:hypothetical protein